MASSRDLFGKLAEDMTDKSARRTRVADASDNYTAADIEVLEGLEPVRRRPGMYIGGTDEKAMHHLFAEVLDNAMDEAVAGHATWIEVRFEADGFLSVIDNGRGIPVDPHPKFPKKSALEVIMCTLHSGGKFDGKAYNTSGGLHGVGVSVVNALSETCEVEVARGQQLYRMVFSRGEPQTKLEKLGSIMNRRGTKVRFRPDEKIFGKGCAFKPATLLQDGAFEGLSVRRRRDPLVLRARADQGRHGARGRVPFPRRPEGLPHRAHRRPDARHQGPVHRPCREAGRPRHGRVGAVLDRRRGRLRSNSYCNTIPTPEGGTHENGLRSGALQGPEGVRRARRQQEGCASITAEDVFGTAAGMLSVFIREPEFQGQTKDKLATRGGDTHRRECRCAMPSTIGSPTARSRRHACSNGPSSRPRTASAGARKKKCHASRRRASCACPASSGIARTNPARPRSSWSRAIRPAARPSRRATRRRRRSCPLRGKILNVANATSAKLSQNQLLSDLVTALGVGTGTRYNDEDLRYDRVIIMTDADVDGAHIASLLMTFFYQETRELIENGHLFLAMPPLYRLSMKGEVVYARNEAHRMELLETQFKNRKPDITRFKGLGEMDFKDLKSTTMDPKVRTLLRVEIAEADREAVSDTVNALMGSKPELRFRFIQDHAAFAKDLDI